jgi:hypothetical protein
MNTNAFTKTKPDWEERRDENVIFLDTIILRIYLRFNYSDLAKDFENRY